MHDGHLRHSLLGYTWLQQDWVEGSRRVSSVLCVVWYRQAALEALQTALESFSSEDHFESVAGPLLATPLQQTQAATSTSGQVAPTSSLPAMFFA